MEAILWKVFLLVLSGCNVVESMQRCRAYKLSSTTATTTPLQILFELFEPSQPSQLMECHIQGNILCPVEFPWAFDNGRRCCAFSERKYGGPLLRSSSPGACPVDYQTCRDHQQRSRICNNFKGKVYHEYKPNKHDVLPAVYNEAACSGDPSHKRRKITKEVIEGSAELRRLTVSKRSSRRYRPGTKLRIPYSTLKRVTKPTMDRNIKGRRLTVSDDCLNNDHCYANSGGSPKFFWIHLEHTFLDKGADLPGPAVTNWLDWAIPKKAQHSYCAQTGDTAGPFVGAHVLYYDTNDCHYKIGILKTLKSCNSKAKGGIIFGGSASLGCAIHCAGKDGDDVLWAKNFRKHLISQYKKATEVGFGYASQGVGGGAYWKCDTIAERLDLHGSAVNIENFSNQFVGPDYWTQKGPFPSKAVNICENDLQIC